MQLHNILNFILLIKKYHITAYIYTKYFTREWKQREASEQNKLRTFTKTNRRRWKIFKWKSSEIKGREKSSFLIKEKLKEKKIKVEENDRHWRWMWNEWENVFSMLLTAVFSSLLCSHGEKSFTCVVACYWCCHLLRCIKKARAYRELHLLN